MTRSLHVTIYGAQESEQVIRIEYSGRGLSVFTVESLKILSEIEIEPTDLMVDVMDAIMEKEKAWKVEKAEGVEMENHLAYESNR